MNRRPKREEAHPTPARVERGEPLSLLEGRSGRNAGRFLSACICGAERTLSMNRGSKCLETHLTPALSPLEGRRGRNAGRFTVPMHVRSKKGLSP
jgi:hypothetical protein